jgi:bacteriorhodopsin
MRFLIALAALVIVMIATRQDATQNFLWFIVGLGAALAFGAALFWPKIKAAQTRARLDRS